MTTQSRSPNGYSAWRLIAEELRREILDGGQPAGAKLATEDALAQRFGVNRHTVRRAVAELADDGLLAARRGSGTYVTGHTVLLHRIGVRTRLSDSVARRGAIASGRLLESAIEIDPPAAVADALGLDRRAALRLEAVRAVDGLPISRATCWFGAERVPGLDGHFRRTGSMTAALHAVGVADYVRAATTVGGRLATATERADLELAPGSVVLVVRALDALPDGRPLQFAVARFAADRVELDVEHPRVDAG